MKCFSTLRFKRRRDSVEGFNGEKVGVIEVGIREQER